MPSELKPCPFCGAESTNGGVYPDKIGMVQTPDTKKAYAVICTQCGASTDYFESEKKAEKAWNRRADNG